ncbi:MAG: acyl--CoA ligase, partial [Ilumatobacteraceae bacterium]|nr:acyl--CoA ligase [Ilumatobacteraceae bacterium]
MSAAPSTFRNIVDPDDAARFRANGWWGDLTVSDHVRTHAADQGDKVAYVTPDHSLTYRQLDVAADRVAAAIVASGAEPGDRVAVMLPDGPTIHAVFVGAERAGVTVIGMGARAGDREITHLLTKTDARRIVTHAEHRGAEQEAFVAGLRGSGLAIDHHIVVPRFEIALATDADTSVLVDGKPVEATALEPDVEQQRRIGPDDLFLVNSTSGTTGMPKCVTHFQNRWMYFHRKAVENGALTGDDVFCAAVPAPFGFGVWTSHVTPLVLGATVLTFERFNAARTLELIERERVTTLCCVSTQFIMLLGEPALQPDRDAGAATVDLSSLRVMFTGGEPVPYLRALDFEQLTGATVLQFYGSNETGLLTGTTLQDDADHRLHTAGKIAAEMEVRLFDDGVDVTDTGRGQPGCRGPALSPGYLDDDAANAAL